MDCVLNCPVLLGSSFSTGFSHHQEYKTIKGFRLRGGGGIFLGNQVKPQLRKKKVSAGIPSQTLTTMGSLSLVLSGFPVFGSTIEDQFRPPADPGVAGRGGSPAGGHRRDEGRGCTD